MTHSAQSTNARQANRLANSISPYLRQHAHNPVDWWPWSPDAIASARELNRPIFLSIGYSACHWCHVMERESFENPQIAEILNSHFICIKVDREEHPDIDETYMIATQLLTGSGGWPMSVWLTPDLKPFYAGTYFPPEDRYNRPGFARVLGTLADAFTRKRTDVEKQAADIVAAIAQHVSSTAAGKSEIDLRKCIADAVAAELAGFDDTFGGSRGAPKFPPHHALNLWLTMAEIAASKKPSPGLHLPAHLQSTAGRMLAITLEQMARGGIYDQLAGGFARYSTDEKWLAPHFEKMLYDNAQLAGIYARAGKLFHDPFWIQTARGTLDFWLNSMTDSRGLFFSALDADSDGEEGKFYVWPWEELCGLFPESADRDLLARHFGISPAGNWESVNVLYLAADAGQIAADSTADPTVIQSRLNQLRGRLLAARNKRNSPALDDKILTGWNGLLIASLAAASTALNYDHYLHAAQRCADALFQLHRDSKGTLLHMSRNGTATGPAYLEDYAFLLDGLVRLARSLEQWKNPAATDTWHRAAKLADELIRDFLDTDCGGFFGTSHRHDALMVRLKPVLDNAIPSPNALAIHALLELAEKLNRPDFQELAMRNAQWAAADIQRHPTGHHSLLAALLTSAARENESGTSLSAPIFDAGNSVREQSKTNLILEINESFSVRQVPSSNSEVILEVPLRLRIAPNYYIELTAGESLGLTWQLTPSSGVWLISVDSPPPVPVGLWPDAPTGLIGEVELVCRLGLACTMRPQKAQLTLRASVCTQGTCLPRQTLMVEIALPPEAAD